MFKKTKQINLKVEMLRKNAREFSEKLKELEQTIHNLSQRWIEIRLEKGKVYALPTPCIITVPGLDDFGIKQFAQCLRKTHPNRKITIINKKIRVSAIIKKKKVKK